MTQALDNLVMPFQLESSHLRGRLARMGEVLDTVLHQHDYPDAVGQLLAEAILVAAALAASLVFTLQAKSDGIVRMLVADVTSDGGIRGYAQFDAHRLDTGEESLLGEGHLAFTCALTGKEDRYQGIVALQGDGIAEAVQHYFRQSEQVPTGIMVAAKRNSDGHWRGGCLLLQRMPRDGGTLGDKRFDVEIDAPEVEDWTRAMLVMRTCTPQELTDGALQPQDLLFRLFHEEGVRVFDTHALRHQCRCSPQRVTGMLRSLPREEIEDLAVGGVVTVTRSSRV